LFGPIRDAAGTGSVEIAGETVDLVVKDATRRFGSDFAALAAHCRVWVNGEPAASDQRVAADDEIALLPPVSGGSQ
jgi:molybdopterin converting factor small subunit